MQLNQQPPWGESRGGNGGESELTRSSGNVFSNFSEMDDLLPLVDSICGVELLSKLCSIAGDDTAPQDVTFGTLPVQARELLTGFSKSLIAAHLTEVWRFGLAQRLAREEQRSFVNKNFPALNPAQQKVFESCIEIGKFLPILSSTSGTRPAAGLMTLSCKMQTTSQRSRSQSTSN